MRCLDKLGANVVIQDEANPGRWAGPAGGGLAAARVDGLVAGAHVGDPSVHFDYNVTPFMVGNLADLAFDGQSSIAQRGLARGRGCTYVGNAGFTPGSPETIPAAYRPYAGPQAPVPRDCAVGRPPMDRATQQRAVGGSSRPARAIRWKRLRRNGAGRRPAVPGGQTTAGMRALTSTMGTGS